MIEKIEINLLPAEYRIHKRTLNIPRSVIYPAAAFVVLAIAAGLYTVHMHDKEATLQNDIEAIKRDIEANKHIQVEMNALREKKKVTEQKIRALLRISVNREKWVRLLEILSGKLPAYSWLMSVREDADDKLNVEARTYSFPEVAHYMSRLEETEYINKVELTGIEQVQGQGRMVYRFNLICTVNKNAGIAGAAQDDEEDAVKEDDTSRRAQRRQRKQAAQGAEGDE